jgi:hypothetical protein
MGTIQFIYLAALLAGLTYAIFSLVMGDLMGAGGDSVGHDFAGGHDLDVGGHEPGSAHAEIHFSPFSPLVISGFLAGVGGIGLFVSGLLTRNVVFHLPVALAAGTAISYLIGFLIFKLKQASEVSSEAVVADLVGCEAEVSAGIPSRGVGEIVYVAKGSRYTAPARTADGQAIAKNQVVTIKDVSGSVMVVELKGSSPVPSTLPAP